MTAAKFELRDEESGKKSELPVLSGTIGFFLVLMILFVRVLPAISIFEVREVLHHLAPHVADDSDLAPQPSAGD